ncbi:MAG: hypothetical protein ACYS1A_09320 [Planctomycetota bacterium]
MHKIRVDVDTSVFGGTQDEEFTKLSRLFFKRVHEGDFLNATVDESEEIRLFCEKVAKAKGSNDRI